MRSIIWKVVLDDKNQIATLENAVGIPQNSVESHLLIIGILDNLKQKHQDKLQTLVYKTVKRSNGLNIMEDNKEDDKENTDI